MRRQLTGLLIGALLVASCDPTSPTTGGGGTGSGSGPATKMVIFKGDNQSAAAGSILGIVPQVKVTDANGDAVGGVSVIFSLGTPWGSMPAINLPDQHPGRGAPGRSRPGGRCCSASMMRSSGCSPTRSSTSWSRTSGSR